MHVGVASQYTMVDGVSQSTWHHVAGAFDGNQITAYLDGVETGTMITGAAVYGADQFLIGCDINIGNQEESLIGALDDVRLYDQVLSAAEVAALAAM